MAKPERIDRCLANAAAALGHAPDFLVEAPGRVNLIGEHTDYNGLPVMPMAIDRSVLVAGVRRADGVVTLRNANAAAFAPRAFAVADAIPAFPAGDWGNYPKAAAQGLRGRLGTEFRRGADLFVDGDVPDAAGLSSSAALVVASALALLAANDRDVAFAELADLLPRAEQYVGTMSGGMDQTISLLAQAGHALRIDFRPLRYRPVPLPGDFVFAVAHSLVHADKSGGARRAYNLRVAECRIATWVLSRILRAQIPAARADSIEVLGDLVAGLPSVGAAEMAAALAAVVPSGALPFDSIAKAVGASPSEMRRSLRLPDDAGDIFTIVERTRHVLREAERVDQAESALRSGEVAAFAGLMRASHASCRDDYGISCPEIEELVQAAEAAGAHAARLTGAGFGGCIVALVARARAAEFVTALDAAFYAPRGLDAEATERARFVLTPSPGASVRRL